MPDGNTEHDAVEIARAFIAHGAAAIDVSSGQVSKDEKPAFGRSYQTPFADRIRHEVARPAGVAVIAVGAISSHDDVNSILLAGRADLCALGRTHLYDPMWSLHAAAEQDYSGPRRAVAEAVGGRPTEAAHLAHRQDPAAAGAAARGQPRTTSTCAGVRPRASPSRRRRTPCPHDAV